MQEHCSSTCKNEINERELINIKEQIKEYKEKTNELERRIYEIEKNARLIELELENNKENIKENTHDINEIQSEPNEQKKFIVSAIIGGIITTVIAYISNRL